jgi:hypothetical protein
MIPGALKAGRGMPLRLDIPNPDSGRATEPIAISIIDRYRPPTAPSIADLSGGDAANDSSAGLAELRSCRKKAPKVLKTNDRRQKRTPSRAHLIQ